MSEDLDDPESGSSVRVGCAVGSNLRPPLLSGIFVFPPTYSGGTVVLRRSSPRPVLAERVSQSLHRVRADMRRDLLVHDVFLHATTLSVTAYTRGH